MQKSLNPRLPLRIGVDTGGTFTDCVIWAHGQVKVLKVFSTPADASAAIVEGISQLATDESVFGVSRPKPAGRRDGHPLELEVIHGTTVGTNSLLERRGARVALVTTKGFEDLLEIGRQARPCLYNLNVQREPPLAPRERRFGVRERIGADGRVLVPLSDADIRRTLRRVKQSGADSLAVCLLFGFANPAHERQLAARLKVLGLPLSVSHEILPEFREYERLSTVVINAYLAPRMGAYLHNLGRRMRARLHYTFAASPHPANRTSRLRFGNARIYVMQSNGGITTAARAARQPVRTILSGPAGGVVASAWLAQQLGLGRAISFDMGGTSTDVCLLDGGPRTTNETSIAGLPVAVPVLDVHSVGAGGGSLARIDSGGALRVGPESAGAIPGPICYGRGGAGLTVTDANLVLGRLDVEHFLGGTFRLATDAARRGFEEFLAGVGRGVGVGSEQELAAGIISVANATMEKALRVISVERGYDPRDFSLICYGGAGGLHAADLACALGMQAVIIPENPGTFSAQGILFSDVVRDVSQSVLISVPAGARSSTRDLLQRIERRLAQLRRAALTELHREGFSADRAVASYRLDLRYEGQSFELSIPFNKDFRETFHREHTKMYGYAYPEKLVEVVNLRLHLLMATPAFRQRQSKLGPAGQPRKALIKTKPVWFAGRQRTIGLYERRRLAAGAEIRGPAVIVEYSATTLVPPDFTCKVDEQRNLILRAG